MRRRSLSHAEAVDGKMGPPDRFGESVSPAAGKNQRHGLRESDPVPLRDEDGPGSFPGADDGADLPISADQGRMASPLFPHRTV